MSETPNTPALCDFISTIHNLKMVKRTGWVNSNVPGAESVADHSFGVGILALILGKSEPGIDRDHCIRMALVHDLAEVIVGDVTPFCGMPKEEKHRREVEAMAAFQKQLKSAGDELMSLFAEYEAGETPEARFVKDLDKLEMVTQARHYEETHHVALPSFFKTTRGIMRHDVTKAVDGETRARRTQ